MIATEDANFYHHFGIDFKGIVRSILLNLKIGKPIYGGSTIPQQLIRSTFLSTEKTAKEKSEKLFYPWNLTDAIQKTKFWNGI